MRLRDMYYTNCTRNVGIVALIQSDNYQLELICMYSIDYLYEVFKF